MEVATTTTDFFKPSSPKDSSIKSRTSRPRSPIKQVTTTSASQKRAICPINVLLPTPEPANKPMRCPRPMVNKPSMARTPIEIISVTRCRLSGSGALRSTAQSCKAAPSSKACLPSMGLPNPSKIRPKRLQPHLTDNCVPLGPTSHSGPTPLASPKGINMTVSSRKPTTSQTIGSLPLLSTKHISPMCTPGTVALITSPVTSVTRPFTAIFWALSIACRYLSSSNNDAGCGLRFIAHAPHSSPAQKLSVDLLAEH